MYSALEIELNKNPYDRSHSLCFTVTNDLENVAEELHSSLFVVFT